MEKIKIIARNMNLQVFMATHERAVIPFLDTVIDLGSNNVNTPAEKETADG
jgi:hypothetical protein